MDEAKPNQGDVIAAKPACRDLCTRRSCGRSCGEPPVSSLGLLAFAWGLLGAGALLARAIWSLACVSSDAFGSGALVAWQWGLAAAWVALMCFFQGYLGFQRGFSLRVVARALHLARHPRGRHALLAPLYCIGLVHASRRRRWTTAAVVAVMLGLVLAVSRVPQPYRGLLDAGVAAGLAWGLVALGVYSVRALLGRPPATSLDLPESVASGALARGEAP